MDECGPEYVVSVPVFYVKFTYTIQYEGSRNDKLKLAVRQGRFDLQQWGRFGRTSFGTVRRGTTASLSPPRSLLISRWSN